MSSKWLDRGFWVSKHFYWQSMIHFLWYSLKHRSFTFFSAANPAIPFGGMLDESKEAIDNLIPEIYRPVTAVYRQSLSLAQQLDSAGLCFPIVIKPDIGLKGHLVRMVQTLDEAQHVLDQLDHDRNWLLQEYIDYRKEFALLFYGYPHSTQSGVLSLIEKRYPTIVGDGNKTVKTLISQYHHPFLDKDQAERKWMDRLEEVLPKGESITISNVGNYSRGATFHSLMEHIDKEFEESCQALLNGISDLHFYRLDLKADSLTDLVNGRFKIIEINGAKGEPLHIYDRRHSFLSNVRDIHLHWKTLSAVSQDMLRTGYSLPSLSQALVAAKQVKRMLT